MIIRLERWESYPNAEGRPQEYVAERHTIRADVKSISGSRDISVGQTRVASKFQFTIRWMELEVKGRWRVVFRGKRYMVESLEQDRKAYWIITASGQN